MTRSVSQLLGAATLSLLALIPSVADATEIDFRRVGHESFYSYCITSTAKTQDAALQIAIWESMHDTTANLGDGNVRLTTTGSIRQAQTYLASLFNVGNDIYKQSVASVLEIARGERGQDQTVAKVSEPSMLLLVGVAFLMFAKQRARRDQHRTEI